MHGHALKCMDTNYSAWKCTPTHGCALSACNVIEKYIHILGDSIVLCFRHALMCMSMGACPCAEICFHASFSEACAVFTVEVNVYYILTVASPRYPECCWPVLWGHSSAYVHKNIYPTVELSTSHAVWLSDCETYFAETHLINVVQNNVVSFCHFNLVLAMKPQHICNHF